MYMFCADAHPVAIISGRVQLLKWRLVTHGSGPKPVRVRKTYTIRYMNGPDRQAGFGPDPRGKEIMFIFQ
jgi:hypothetical protein